MTSHPFVSHGRDGSPSRPLYLGRVEHPCSTAADQGWSALPNARSSFPVSGFPLSEYPSPPPATRGRHPPPVTSPLLRSCSPCQHVPARLRRAHLCTFARGSAAVAPLHCLPPRRLCLRAYFPASGAAPAAFTPAGNSPRSSNAVMVALKVTVPAVPRSAVMERLPMARYGARDFTLS